MYGARAHNNNNKKTLGEEENITLLDTSGRIYEDKNIWSCESTTV